MDYRKNIQIFVEENRTKKATKTPKTSLLPMGWDGVSVAYLFLLGNPLFLHHQSRCTAPAFGISDAQQVNAFGQIPQTDLICFMNDCHMTAYGIIDLHLIRLKALDMHPVSSGIGINEY